MSVIEEKYQQWYLSNEDTMNPHPVTERLSLRTDTEQTNGEVRVGVGRGQKDGRG